MSAILESALVDTLGGCRTIAVQPVLAKAFGSLTAAVMISQALYWRTRTSDPDGWFYKTRDEWTEETSLSRREQEGARKALDGVLVTELRGIPAQLFYRVDVPALIARVKAVQQVGTKPPNKEVQNRPTGRAETAQLSITESTAKTTTEITMRNHLGKTVSKRKLSPGDSSPRPKCVDEVKTEFLARGSTVAEAERFWNFYECKGWKVGKNPMVKWRAAVANWLSRNQVGGSSGRAPRKSMDEKLAELRRHDQNAGLG